MFIEVFLIGANIRLTSQLWHQANIYTNFEMLYRSPHILGNAPIHSCTFFHCVKAIIILCSKWGVNFAESVDKVFKFGTSLRVLSLSCIWQDRFREEIARRVWTFACHFMINRVGIFIRYRTESAWYRFGRNSNVGRDNFMAFLSLARLRRLRKNSADSSRENFRTKLRHPGQCTRIFCICLRLALAGLWEDWKYWNNSGWRIGSEFRKHENTDLRSISSISRDILDHIS